jgi:two-component system response regulator ChvI
MTIKETECGVNGRQRIMVVNNDQDMLRLLNRTLELEGFDTVVVADEDVALNLLEKLSPDMVIMDTGVPDAESLRTLDLMREQSNVPIIILTTNNEVETLRTVFSHGADDIIRKPFATRSFIARIRAKLRRYQREVPQPS